MLPVKFHLEVWFTVCIIGNISDKIGRAIVRVRIGRAVVQIAARRAAIERIVPVAADKRNAFADRKPIY